MPLFTEESYIDRETVLDVVVNAVPVAILALFVVVYLLINPFGNDPGMVVIQHFLTLFPLTLLVLLTYVAARVVSRDEEAAEQPARERQHD